MGKNADTRLVASHKVSVYSSETYHNVEVAVDYVEYHTYDQPLRGLKITAQQDAGREGNRDGRLYAWSVAFHHGWGIGVDLDDAERMMKILRGIKASLARQEAKYGSALDFAQYVLRVADALDINFVECRDGYGDTLAGAGDQIRQWERDFAAQYDAKVETE